MKLAALALASLIGLSTVARADTPYDGPPPARAQVRANVRAAIVARFDRDGDGRLSPKERRHAAKALRRIARRLARAERRAARGGEPRVDVDVRWDR